MSSLITLTGHHNGPSGKPFTAGGYSIPQLYSYACGHLTLTGLCAQHRTIQTPPGVYGVVPSAAVKTIREGSAIERMGGGAKAPPKPNCLHNEAPELSILDSIHLKCAQGLSPRSSASLYLKTQSSTPCAMLAKSRDSTFLSRYSITSGGRVILIDLLLRFCAMHDLARQKMLNIYTVLYSIARLKRAGESKNGRNTTYSGRYAPETEEQHETDISLKQNLGDRLHGSLRRIQAGGEDHSGDLGESLRCSGRGSANSLRRNDLEDLGDRALIEVAA